MLIRFNVKNFLSFNKTAEGNSIEFSMIAGKTTKKREHLYDDGNIKLLKLATIYGANASGKSSLIKALDFTKNVIVNGLFEAEGYIDKYCKLLEDNKNLPSYFELEIEIEKRYFAYGFEIILSQSKFISEWLFELSPSGKEELIFRRDITEGQFEFGKKIKRNDMQKLNVYSDDIREDDSALFLNIMNQNKDKFYENQKNKDVIILKKLYDWIRKNFEINFPNRPISNYNYLSRSNNIEKVSRIVSSFGTGITGFHIVNIKPEKFQESIPDKIKGVVFKDIEKRISNLNRNLEINPDKKDKTKRKFNFGLSLRINDDIFIITIEDGEIVYKTVKFEHESQDVLFKFSEESDGTRRILDLIEVLLSDKKTYVIDELDRCLHPILTYKFIESFLELAKSRDVQLIVTTHESRLLDFDLLRRDEVWFINKNINGESEVYSLEEYNERFDKKIDKAYLEGRYGGIPVFNTLFPVDYKE